MNKKTILIIGILFLLVVAGCEGGTKKEQRLITDVDLRKGTDGLTMEFVKNAPPESVFEDTVFPIAVRLHNEGAEDIKESGKLVFGFETAYVDLFEKSEERELLWAKKRGLEAEERELWAEKRDLEAEERELIEEAEEGDISLELSKEEEKAGSESIVPVPDDFHSTCKNICGDKGCIGGVDDGKENTKDRKDCDENYRFEGNDDYCFCGNSEKVIPVPDDYDSTCYIICSEEGKRCARGVDDRKKGKSCRVEFGFEGDDDYCICTGETEKIVPLPFDHYPNCNEICEAKEKVCMLAVDNGNQIKKCGDDGIRFEGDDDYCVCGDASQRVVPGPLPISDRECKDVCPGGMDGCMIGIDDGNDIKKCDEDFGFEVSPQDDYCFCGEASQKIDVVPQPQSKRDCNDVCGSNVCLIGIDEGSDAKKCTDKFDFDDSRDYCICGNTFDDPESDPQGFGDVSQKIVPLPFPGDDPNCGQVCTEKGLSCDAGVDDGNNDHKKCSEDIEFDKDDDYCICWVTPKAAVETPPIEKVEVEGSRRLDKIGKELEEIEDKINIKRKELKTIVEELEQGKLQELKVGGKSIFNPKGDEEFITLNAQAKRIGAQSETQSSTILATACYPYKTILGASICVDTDIYGMKRGEKACSVRDLKFGDGQGAPVAVTKIETRMLPQDDNNVKPHFLIHIKNKGNGQVIKLSEVEKACTEKPLDYKDFNTILIKASLSGVPLDCRVNKNGHDEPPEPATIRLKGKEDLVRCTYTNTKVIEDKDAYVAPLNIELEYGYTFTISKDIIIEKILTH